MCRGLVADALPVRSRVEEWEKLSYLEGGLKREAGHQQIVGGQKSEEFKGSNMQMSVG